MTELHAPDHHADSGIKSYLVIFGALIIFTAVSFLANVAVRAQWILPHTSFAIILGVAVCKAILVAVYFMHLKVDWGRLYFMIVPALILGVMFVIVLLPDIVLAWHAGTAPSAPVH